MGAVAEWSFGGDVAFVTGASGGMGEAIAVALARAGASVVLADIDEERGATALAAARAAGPGDAVFVSCDVADAASVAAAVGVATSTFGGLNLAVNAAAIENETAPLHECEDDRFDRMQAVNVRGCFLSMKHELLAMLAGGRGGSIVNIASTNSVRPQPIQPAYTASKHAVLGLTRQAAVDYAAHGIRINCICPGGIDTPMLRNAMERRGRDPIETAKRLSLFGRFGTPSEIADAALYLCSDASSYVTGHGLAVDSGYLAR